MISLTIPGPIPSKKNTQRISRYGGIYKDASVSAYEKQFAHDIIAEKLKPVLGKFIISGELYLNNRKDIDNALTTVLDALQYAGIIANDLNCMGINMMKIEAKKKDEKAVIRIEECPE
jgi:Holliday junction resolvase RusA-like endonuclease